ncbi:hypothetical protein NGC32_08605 [Kluyvera cryocrescens]|uniref:hypothetical protein n=1 Tax=Kluyvera cryocrescens TaxID=580 RepID=UPI002DB84DBF|nr:hypothetical protein [Kluyvera cryocrescens]MEB7712788.1 hypothetical protein [Kluyvera cryocrescens]
MLKIIILALLFSAPVAAKDLNKNIIQDYGRYTLKGRLLDGDVSNPGKKTSLIKNGDGYSGLLLDATLDIRPLINHLDADSLQSYSALKDGTLQHLQIDMTNKQSKFYNENYGKHVSVLCNIEFIGRYFTPVYCEVISFDKK